MEIEDWQDGEFEKILEPLDEEDKWALLEHLFDEKLSALCAEWQRRLRLQDWNVEVCYAKYYEMQSKDSDGECDYVLSCKNAQIRILCPDDCPEPIDVEAVLVHELLHLHFAEWTERRDECPVSGELAIDIIAQTLVNLKREKVER